MFGGVFVWGCLLWCLGVIMGTVVITVVATVLFGCVVCLCVVMWLVCTRCCLWFVHVFGG